jgi:hypothetical protein
MKFLLTSIYLVVTTMVAIAPASHAQAAILNFTANLNGANEEPPISSLGTGTSLVTLDTILNTLRIQGTFSGLTGTSTVAHIHSATTVPGSGNAGVATVPTLPGFPVGVQSGSFDTVLDLTQPGSYRAVFITDNGGTTATAQAALTASLGAGTAYFNIHSSFATGGEIRGFLTPVAQSTAVPEPSSILGILTTFGAASILKRKIKASKSVVKETINV